MARLNAKTAKNLRAMALQLTQAALKEANSDLDPTRVTYLEDKSKRTQHVVGYEMKKKEEVSKDGVINDGVIHAGDDQFLVPKLFMTNGPWHLDRFCAKGVYRKLKNNYKKNSGSL